MSLKKSVMITNKTNEILKNVTLENKPNYSSALNTIAEQFEIMAVNALPVLTNCEKLLFLTVVKSISKKVFKNSKDELVYFKEFIFDAFNTKPSLSDDISVVLGSIIKLFQNNGEDINLTIEKFSKWSDEAFLSVLYFSKKYAREMRE